MTAWTEDAVATELLACEADRRDRVKFTDEWSELDLDTGYRIQDETLRRRLARGEAVTGVKLGLTSKAKQERMGVDTPLVAWLTDAMVLQPGDPVPQQALIHPRVEPEIVFVMGKRLDGPGVTAEQALAAVATVSAGAEVIDSRYRDFRFAAGDVVADNASSGAYVVSPDGIAPSEVDLVAEAVRVEVDGELVHDGTGADVLGPPCGGAGPGRQRAVPARARDRGGLDVLTGGITDAVFATPGSTVVCRFSTLGDVALSCGEAPEVPLVEITLVEGRSPEQLRGLMAAVTQAVHESVGAPVASIRVVLREVPTTHWAAGDVTIAEREAHSADRRPVMSVVP